MHFDTALNVAWLLLGAMALVITLALSRRTSFSSRQLHFIGVAAIVVSLFPYISATDDVLRIEHFNAQETHSHEGKDQAGDNLLRLYETLDSPLIYGTCGIVLTLIFHSLLAVPVGHLLRRSIPLEAGRSPPLLPFLA